MRTLVATILIVLIGCNAWADSGPIVKVAGGQIRGALLDKGGAVFKGIPYAQPPVGDLRWRDPVPVKSWSGVRAATALGAICAQSTHAQFSKEDCLYLNVWTPEWPIRVDGTYGPLAEGPEHGRTDRIGKNENGEVTHMVTHLVEGEFRANTRK